MSVKKNAIGWSGSVLFLAILSATCGALASVFGKIAFDSAFIDKHSLNSYPVKGILVIIILSLNAIMLSLYVRVLQAVSALQASLLAFVCNYMISTAFGVLVFGESISLKWSAGAILMTAGAIRVAKAGSQETKPKVKKSRKIQ